MVTTTLTIDGMMCAMCESHINDAIRQSFNIKKVSSPHGKGTTEILSKSPLEETKLREAVGNTGDKVLAVETTPYEKKRFSFFGR